MSIPDEIKSFNLKEEISWLAGFNGFTGLWGQPGTSNIYAPIAGGSGAPGGFFAFWYWLQTQWWCRWQRYAARYAYISNAYASTLVNNLTILALGSGFQIQTPNKSKQKKLDKWVVDTKFRTRDIEAFRRYLIDGEVFIRKFDDDKLRFIDPDYIYSSTNDKDVRLGIISQTDDYEDVVAYQVHTEPNGDFQGEDVPADEIQHRKNAHFGQRRGFSWLLPVLSDVFGADRLTNNLIKTSDVLSAFAFFRKHMANSSSVQQFRDQISTQAVNQYPVGQNGTPPVRLPSDNIENYAPGSIVDLPQSVELEQLTGLPAESYVAALDATLRKCAAHFHLPSGVFNLRDSNESYNSELVSNSYIVRSIEAMQEEWKEYDLELLRMCGFDTDDINLIAPEVSIIDRTMLAQEMAFLMERNLVSRETVSKSFGLDPQAEADMIKKNDGEARYGDANSRELQPGQQTDQQQVVPGIGQDLRGQEPQQA